MTDELGLTLNELNVRDSNIIQLYDEHQLLKHPQLWELNPFLTGGFVRLLSNDDPYQFLVDFINAVNKEVESVITLSAEWFTPLSHNISLMNGDGHIDIEALSNIWDQHYQDVIALQLFDKGNEDFEQCNSEFKTILFNLFRICGLPQQFVEDFFLPAFQDFMSIVIDLVLGVNKMDFEACFHAVNRFMQLNVTGTPITNQASFNAVLLDHLEEYGQLIELLIGNFGIIRKTTVAIIESYVFPESPNPSAQLKGDADLRITALADFNSILATIIANENIEIKHKNIYNSYLRAVENNELKNTGFEGVASRQLRFFADYDPINEAHTFQQLSPTEKKIKIATRNKDIDDLSILHRMSFILIGCNLLTAVEKVLFFQKIADIIKSPSANFYADVFELYFYFLAKISGVEIGLLPSQTAGGQEVSTCDYKFGKTAAADCKCIITDNMKMHNISAWCDKIGEQVQSTIGYEGVEFGGGVIAMKDQEIDFLQALRQFKGTDRYNLEEKAFVISLLLEIYSEFRRHTKKQQDKVKFIVLYYIPVNPITEEELDGIAAYSIKQVNEILAVITTKYASDQEFDAISEIFKPIAHFIFKFNNKLQ